MNTFIRQKMTEEQRQIKEERKSGKHTMANKGYTKS